MFPIIKLVLASFVVLFIQITFWNMLLTSRLFILQKEDVDNESGEEVVPDVGLEIVGQALKSLSMPAVSVLF
jgi:hypothetical protein